MSDYIFRGKADFSQHDATIKKSAGEVLKYEKAVDSAKKDMNKFGGSVKSAMGDLKNFNGLNFNNIKAQFSGIGESLGGVISKVPALGGLGGALTSLINPITAISTAIGASVVAFFNYNKELENARDLTQQFIGISGNQLNSLVSGIESVAKTWKVEYRDVLSAVDNLMCQFGIDGETALNIIRDGFVSGANEGGHMLSMMGKYSGAFRDMSISASEMTAIIANTRSGIFSETGMDLIAKAGNKIRMMMDETAKHLKAIGINTDEMKAKLSSGAMSTFEALQLISSKLAELPPQSAEVGRVLQAVFEEQGSAQGLALVTALADVNDNLEEMKLQTGDVGQAQLHLQEATRNLQNAMASMFGVSNGGYNTMFIVLKTKVYNAVAKLINGFADWYDNSLILRYVISAIGLAIKNTWEIFKLAGRQIVTSLRSMTNILEDIITLDFKSIGKHFTEAFDSMKDNVVKFGKATAQNYSDAFEQTIHGKIQRVIQEEVGSAVTTASGGGSGNGGGNNGGSSGNGGSTSTQKVKAEVIAVAGSIKFLQDQLAVLNKELTTTIVSDDRLAQIQKEKQALEEEIKALQKKYGLLVETAKVENNNATTVKQDDTQYYNDLASAVSSVGTAFSSMGEIASEGGNKMLNFMSQISQATAKLIPEIAVLVTAKQAEATASGVAGASKMPYPASIAAIMSIVATLVGVFASLPKFASGGIVSGNSRFGDLNLARVNSGEMILNTTQQRHLWSILNNGGTSVMQQPMPVTFHISGSDLIGVINNATNKFGKVK